MDYFIGIDIGSTSSKTVALNEDLSIACAFVLPTGWSSVDTAELIRKRLEEGGIDAGKNRVIATGYGRISVPYADKAMTEITCHARGSVQLYGYPRMTVIDIGGQDTKIIAIEDNAVSDFSMNDKCSAGTGRFLEVMANTLGVSPAQLCEAARVGGDTHISSMCTVFAESEVISLIGRGEKRENIAFAVIDSIACKVASQAKRLLGNGPVCLTGGLCDSPYILEALGRELKREIETRSEARYAGALGAALYAAKK